MELIHFWHGDRYSSKSLRGTIPIPVYDFKVKVIYLEFLGKCVVFSMSVFAVFDGFDSWLA